MENINPLWQTTDEDEQPVRITANGKQTTVKRAVPSIPRAKRSPAAFIGIALCLTAGYAMFQGVNGLTGQSTATQTTTDAINVTINEDAVDPVFLLAEPGSTITWTNKSTIPHILSSDTLPTSDGKPFETNAIFPDTTFSYTIPADAEPGVFDYESKTSPSISGQIVIDAAADAAATNTDETGAATTDPVDVGASTEVVVAPTMATSSIATTAPATQEFVPEDAPSTDGIALDSGIMLNPHTVGNGEMPLPPRQAPGTGTPLHSGAPLVSTHRPTTTAQSGTESLWLVGFGTAALLFVATRKAFARI